MDVRGRTCLCILKTCGCYFFKEMIAFQKLWIMLLFHLRSSFCSRDIKIFVFAFLSTFSKGQVKVE